ncbi:LacI family DNA-binding transcriptional regulator [Microbacterium sp. Se63.02b]|uniref:LacI family DNA-binding transcriptional regulator n=1 Tax=Microbacterium sp. Se63.02b TaxID=2709304 RepID=UPI001604F46C|nr:LacI family DNA-binding transcriptional regulator [Microbacterium sp. Se63.02b]QNA91823.1 LacI family transcriptional regulator [Microbacterium sp. Se63.02b]
MRSNGRPTMNDVAAAAGVSLKTVSRVINAEPNVDATMASRVAEAIERLGYHRNALAASLRSGTNDTVAFLAADLSNSFYMGIAAAVSTVAAHRRMHVVMASSEEDPATERRVALDLCQRRVGGLILVPTSADHSYLAPEVAHGTPVVFLDRPGNGIHADTVLLDNRGGARAAVAELLAAGHERIAMLLDTTEIYTMDERLAGALEAFAAAGRSQDPALLITGVHTPADARAAVSMLLDSAAAPTALFCGNNRATVGALEELMVRDADIAVTGFDDFELSWMLPRPIRVVSYDVSALGTLAATTLLDRIAGGPLADPSLHLVPTSLVDRGGRSR